MYIIIHIINIMHTRNIIMHMIMYIINIIIPIFIAISKVATEIDYLGFDVPNEWYDHITWMDLMSHSYIYVTLNTHTSHICHTQSRHPTAHNF